MVDGDKWWWWWWWLTGGMERVVGAARMSFVPLRSPRGPALPVDRVRGRPRRRLIEDRPAVAAPPAAQHHAPVAVRGPHSKKLLARGEIYHVLRASSSSLRFQNSTLFLPLDINPFFSR